MQVAFGPAGRLPRTRRRSGRGRRSPGRMRAPEVAQREDVDELPARLRAHRDGGDAPRAHARERLDRALRRQHALDGLGEKTIFEGRVVVANALALVVLNARREAEVREISLERGAELGAFGEEPPRRTETPPRR